MNDNDLSLKSVEVTLSSGIGQSSATLMRDAYLSPSMENSDRESCISPDTPDKVYPDERLTGPDARVYITKILSRTPNDVIEQVLKRDSCRTTLAGNQHYFTLILTMSLRPGDPATTRLINGMIECVFPEDVEILSYSPKDKGRITALLERRGDEISLDPELTFLAGAARNTTGFTDTPEDLFEIPVGPNEKLPGTYSGKTGYSFVIPEGLLLEYQGMLKNHHVVFWEIYPPMPPYDEEFRGHVMIAVFAVSIRTPQNSPPKIRIIMDCRMKGNLWGVIPLKNISDIP